MVLLARCLLAAFFAWDLHAHAASTFPELLHSFAWFTLADGGSTSVALATLGIATIALGIASIFSDLTPTASRKRLIAVAMLQALAFFALALSSGRRRA